jgi:nitrogen-specific signal transduction histidine kinase
MASDADLDHLTTLLCECLGRIDERAYQLQQLGDEDVDLDPHDVLTAEATTLHELVGSLLDRCAAVRHAAVAPIVARAIDGFLQELGAPVVVRRQFDDGLPPVACDPGQLAFAVQRALLIAAGRLETGGELAVAVRAAAEAIVIEIETRGVARDRHLQQRAETLCDFVAAFRGNCRIELPENGHLLIAIDLPRAVPVED